MRIPQSPYPFHTDRPEAPTRCAMCGFINDLDSVPSGDSFQSPGITYGAQVVTSFAYPVPSGSKPITMTITTIEPFFSSGVCGFCGTMNSVGNRLNDPFGTGVDLTGR